MDKVSASFHIFYCRNNRFLEIMYISEFDYVLFICFLCAWAMDADRREQIGNPPYQAPGEGVD